MIIHSLRLKNVKSYGEGPEGRGVTVPFHPGVNRIAGLNGHGKTTLIECLGYALFLTEPVFEENFKTETYFLRSGSKAGEIDVTFRVGGETYRIERGLGPQNRIRAKVVQTRDESLCAEGEREVGEFLCRLLGLPDPGRLQEVFSKLVGVKQGRLAWPFDSKPGEAKRFFEPLLEVEVFRQCYERLKPALDAFARERGEHATREAAVAERIRERADSPEELARCRAAVASLAEALAATTRARDEALAEKKLREDLERAFEAAGVAREAARAAASAAADRATDAAARVAESERAAAAAEESRPAHDAYLLAEDALKALEERRRVRDQLQAQRAGAEGERTDREARARAAADQAAEFLRLNAQKEGERQALAAAVGPLRHELEAGAEAFREAQRAARAAESDRGAVRAWVEALPPLRRRLAALGGAIAAARAELEAWDPGRLEVAREAERAASEALRGAREALAGAEARRASLAGQLEQLGGGVCPFLGEPCGQFDPQRVRAGLAALDAEIEAGAGRVTSLAAAHAQAQSALAPLASAESQLAGRRRQLASDLEACRHELASALPGGLGAAVGRLEAWHEGLGSFPALAAPDAGPIDPEAVAAGAEAFEACAAAAERWWRAAAPLLQERLDRDARAATDRAAQEARLKALAAQGAGLEAEVAGLAQKASEREAAARRLGAEAAGLGEVVARLDEELGTHAGLDGEVDARAAARDAARPGHELHLRALPLAEDLGPRRELLARAREGEAAAAHTLEERERALAAARAAHDPARLAAAREEYERQLGEGTRAEANLGHARAECAKQEVRVAQWRGACEERERIQEQIARCEAAMEVTELARRTLRDAAPAVAQHLCNRIAVRAQAVFNRIHPDPVELRWEAERYSLRISPGERRFAMLSGGEQTKLALAMTLAMVAEFSGLRFCIFDEPTYGVDADSRSKLAEAVLEAQEAAGLDQLLLVSHDDAFEGKIEHAVVLKKSAAHGTYVLPP